MVVYITASPSPNRAMCARALFMILRDPFFDCFPPAIAPEAKISPTAPRNHTKGSKHVHPHPPVSTNFQAPAAPEEPVDTPCRDAKVRVWSNRKKHKRLSRLSIFDRMDLKSNK